MNFLYNIGLSISWILLRLLSYFNPKIKKFVEGRKEVQSYLKANLADDRPVIWFHAASLGEYEQGLPIIEKLRVEFPGHSILLTFFSPSGYEVRRNTKAVDAVCYLPMDSKRNVAAFLETVQPVLAVFIKYEIWPNYLSALQKKGIPTVLISAIFSERQVYFKWYGKFMRNALRRFTEIFVQNEKSKDLLLRLGIDRVIIGGDTRFDRVSVIRKQNNSLPFMEKFNQDFPCFVAGSTWPEDEEILIDFIDNYEGEMRFVIAPHDIKADHIKQLKEGLNKRSILYSEIDAQKLEEYRILIIDTIGLLTKVYSYADMAYVGGGFATGLHNTLEPAVFGIPVLIGPKYHNFQEALDLVHQKGILVIRDKSEFKQVVEQLMSDDDFRTHTGLVNSTYISAKKGASIQIMDHLRTLL